MKLPCVDRGPRVPDAAIIRGWTGCHGKALTGKDWSDPAYGTIWTAKLARAVPCYSSSGLDKTIRSGVRPDCAAMWDMPLHLFTQVTAEDMAVIIGFLRTVSPAGVVHPPPVFSVGARAEMAAGIYLSSPAEVAKPGGQWPPPAGDRHALGRYIVRATCAECHGIGSRGGKPPPGRPRNPDLRIVAGYDAAEFAHLMRTGIAVGDREVGLMTEVARGRFRHLQDDEIAAVHGYLQAVAAAVP